MNPCGCRRINLDPGSAAGASEANMPDIAGLQRGDPNRFLPSQRQSPHQRQALSLEQKSKLCLVRARHRPPSRFTFHSIRAHVSDLYFFETFVRAILNKPSLSQRLDWFARRFHNLTITPVISDDGDVRLDDLFRVDPVRNGKIDVECLAEKDVNVSFVSGLELGYLRFNRD